MNVFGWIISAHLWMEIFVPGFAAQSWLSRWQIELQGKTLREGLSVIEKAPGGVKCSPLIISSLHTQPHLDR